VDPKHQWTGRAASVGLAAVLCLLATLMTSAGFVTHQAGQRVARATELHEAVERARFGLSAELAQAHGYIATRDPEVRAAFRSTAADVTVNLELALRGSEPASGMEALNLLAAHDSFTAAAERAFELADAPDAPENEIHTQIGGDPGLLRLRGALASLLELREAHVAVTVLELEQITLVLWWGTPLIFLLGLIILRRIWTQVQAHQRGLRALVGSLDDIVFEFDGEGTYLNIWASDESLLAAPRESLLGRRVTDVLGEEIGGPYVEIFKRVLGTGQPEQLEYSLDVEAGTRWFLASISPVRLSTGEFRTVSMLSRDITERKHFEAELFQAQKLESVGRLAAGIAHEINTPIQFIGDNVHFLRDSFASLERFTGAVRAGLDGAGDGTNGAAASGALRADIETAAAEADLEYLTAEIPSAIEQTLDGVAQVATIVQAMKEFAHPEGGERVAVDLNRALTSTLTVARNELKYLADIEAEYAELPPVNCHPSAINQVFLNLLVNAAHAIADRGEGSRGTIRVRTARDGDEVVVEIADTGCGIPDQVKSKIFDQFFTTKGVGRGTGQGLAVARRIVVDQHGGVISFESEVGRGTSFFVRLPLEDREPGRANGVPASSR
jgi:PAS domain S-box-containing protein